MNGYLTATEQEKAILIGIIDHSNTELVVNDYLRELAENAVIRSGDFPWQKNSVDVTVVFSQLAFVQKIRDYYDRASAFAHTQKDRLRETSGRLRDMEDAAKELPSLI